MYITETCMRAGPCFTPPLQEELTQIPFQALYSIVDNYNLFWYFSEEIVNMLDKQVCHDYLNCDESVTNWQNLQEEFSHIISDLQAVCLRITGLDEIRLIYEVQHSHILQIQDLDLDSVFPIVVDSHYDVPFKRVVKILFTEHPNYHRLEFTGQHYTTVAEYFTTFFFGPP